MGFGRLFQGKLVADNGAQLAPLEPGEHLARSLGHEVLMAGQGSQPERVDAGIALEHGRKIELRRASAG